MLPFLQKSPTTTLLVICFLFLCYCVKIMLDNSIILNYISMKYLIL